MITVKHKFRDYQIKEDVEILILGTFNPDYFKNKAEFFYGRKKNNLWTLLPAVFGESSLQNSSVEKKAEFITKNKIGFIDLISEVIVEDGEEDNYSDAYIDKKFSKWSDVCDAISKLSHVKKVFFTRKTFSGIPNIKSRIQDVQAVCKQKNIEFHLLPTPARFINEDKINQWKQAFSL